MKRRSAPTLPAILFLLLVNGLLGGLVYSEMSNPELFVRQMQVVGTVAPSETAQPARAGAPAVPTMPGEAAFSVISERPLFSTERRPPEVTQTPPSGPVSPQAPPFVVIGIVGAGEDSVAILKDISPGAQREPGQVVRAGDTVEGWTVDAILPAEGKVVLVNGERRHELELVDDEPGPQRPGVRVPRAPVVRPPVVRTPQPQATAPAQRQIQPPQPIPGQVPATE